MASSKPIFKMEKITIYEVDFEFSANINGRGCLSRKNRIQIEYGNNISIKSKRVVSKLLPTKVVIDSFRKSETGLPEGWITLHGKCSVITTDGKQFVFSQFYDYEGVEPSIKGFYKNFKGTFGPDAPKYINYLKVELQGDIRCILEKELEGLDQVFLDDDLFEIPD